MLTGDMPGEHMTEIKANDSVFDKYADAETLKRIVSYESVSEMWDKCVEMYADSSAVADNGSDYSYMDIENEASFFRAVLLSAGLKRGDYVGLYAPNSKDFVVSFIAITTLGMCAVLLPPQLLKESVFGCAMKFGLKALVYAKALEGNLALIKEKKPSFPLLCADETVSGIVGASETSARKAGVVKVSRDEPCAVLFTGGTTGPSKGALLSNGAVMCGTKNGCYGYKNVFNQRYLLILPLTHVFGLIRTLLTSLYTGSSLYICRNNKDMFKDIAIHKPTLLVMVPALAEMALNLSKQFGRNMLGDDLRTVIAGAAVVSPYLVSEYKNLGIDLFPGYGLTESANLVSGNPEMCREPVSVGFLYPGMSARVVDGELWIKGPNVFTRYVADEEENKRAFEDGYFKTGDLVRFSDEGLLYIVGRKKELIVLSSGEKISPAQLETEFNKADCIQDSLVYSVFKNGHETLTLEVLPRAAYFKERGIADVKAFVSEELGNINGTLPSTHRVNEIIVRSSDFIRTPSMKIDRAKNTPASQGASGKAEK